MLVTLWTSRVTKMNKNNALGVSYTSLVACG